MDGTFVKNRGVRFIKNAQNGSVSIWKYAIFIGIFFIFSGYSFFHQEEGLRQIQNAISIYGELWVFTSSLINFAVMMLFLCLWIRFVHRLPLKDFITIRSRVDWGRFFFAFFLWVGMLWVVMMLSYVIYPDDFQWNFNRLDFTILFCVSTILIPFQAGFEELFFRGYLLRCIGIKTRSLILSLVVSSVLFGLMHISNPEMEHLGYILMIYYIGSGLLFGAITLIDGGLELSLGLHIANNWFISLWLTSKWSVLQTPSIFKDEGELSVWGSVFIPVFVMYPIILYIFARRYKWGRGFFKKLSATF